MKDEIRVLGIDDGYFLKQQKQSVLVVGAVLRGNRELDGVLSCSIEKDGKDATRKLSELVNNSKYKGQLRAIMTNGITMAGFNVLDLQELSRKTCLPVLSVIRKKPDHKKIERALDNFSDGNDRLALIKKAGEIYSHKSIYFQKAGLTDRRAREIIDKTILKSNIPEPIRIAHLIASGVTYGQSTKRA
jgi:hypothetical protein